MSVLSILEGMEGHVGHRFPGYEPGNDNPAATLVPGVDPATADALVRSREALHRNRPAILWDPPRVVGLPPLGDVARLAKWTTEVRAESFMAELMGPIRQHADPADDSFSVFHQDDGGKRMRIASLIRPDLSLFQSQVQMVVDTVSLRPERLGEVITQIGIPVQFWSSILDLNPTSTPFTLELLTLALAFGSAVTQPCKHTFGCPRPALYSASVQPVINPRRFGCFPSGHAMEAFLTARLLQRLTSQALVDAAGRESGAEQQLQRLAMRIADHRVVAGVHFPIDSTAGRMLGDTLALYLIHRCSPSDEGAWIERTFDGKVAAQWQRPFDRHDDLDGPSTSAPFFNRNSGTTHSATRFTVVQGGASVLGWLWGQARAEWR